MRTVYPLTPEARSEAGRLLAAWDAGQLQQYFSLRLNPLTYALTAGPGIFDPAWNLPPAGALLELAAFDLIGLRLEGGEWHVVLLQALRDAVASGFAVSDFYLLTHARGTILAGEGAGVAAMAGLPSPAMAGMIMARLDPAMLDDHPELMQAVQALADAPPDKMRPALIRVAGQLGRALEVASNAASLIEALSLVAGLLGTLA